MILKLFDVNLKQSWYNVLASISDLEQAFCTWIVLSNSDQEVLSKMAFSTLTLRLKCVEIDGKLHSEQKKSKLTEDYIVSKWIFL